MAKVVSKNTDAPAKNDVYVGMLLLTVLATGIGITCLALELNEDYKWESVPKGGPPIAKKEAPKAETPKEETPKPMPMPEEKDKTQAPAVEPIKPDAAFAPPTLPPVTPVSATVPALPKPVTPPLALPSAPPTIAVPALSPVVVPELK